MTKCEQCTSNETRHGHPRPLFTLTLPLLKITVESAREEVRHELSHRASAGARNLLRTLSGPIRTPRLFSRGPDEFTRADEKSMREQWFKNQLYLQRIHDKPGAANFVSRFRQTNEA